MMVKLKNIRDDKESREFEFKVFLTKRPEVYPNWDDPESDEEEVQSDVFFGKTVSRVAGCLWPTLLLLFEEKPMPNILLSYVKNLASKDMC